MCLKIKHHLILLSLWLAFDKCDLASGSTIFQKVFPGNGVLSCILVDRAVDGVKNPVGLDRSKGQLQSPEDYRVLWTPNGKTTPEILWQILPDIERSRMAPVYGTGVFLPLDAHVWPDHRVLLVYRTMRDVQSVVLQIGHRFVPSEAGLRLVTEENTRKYMPIRVYGSGQLGGNLKPDDLSLVLDGTRGREVYGYDGKAWHHLRVEPYPPFEKDIPGFGKVMVRQTDVAIPTGFEAPSNARKDSREMQALMAQITDDWKAVAYLQSLHRHKFYLQRHGSTEPVELFEKLTYFSPKRSRCPTGFRVLDALVVSDRIYFVYLEQELVRWASVVITNKGGTLRESRQQIGVEFSHRTHTQATLSLAPVGGGLRVEVSGSGGRQSVLLDEKYGAWEAKGREDK